MGGDPFKLAEERRDEPEPGTGEEHSVDRREAVDWRFCKAGMDLRRSPWGELELGARRGVACVPLLMGTMG